MYSSMNCIKLILLLKKAYENMLVKKNKMMNIVRYPDIFSIMSSFMDKLRFLLGNFQ